MERLLPNHHVHLHGASCCVDDGDAFLTLSCGASSSTEAAACTTPALRRRRRRRGKQSSSSFECRTCGRRFATFQALGGHRTSHLRRPATTKKQSRSSKAVLVHACAACGLGFSTGQALGGHMRKHRGGGGPAAGCVVGLARVVGLERPSSSASLQLLDLFV